MKFFYMCVLLALVATLCLSPVAAQPSMLTRFKRQAISIMPPGSISCPENYTCLKNRCVTCEKYMEITEEDSCPKENCKARRKYQNPRM